MDERLERGLADLLAGGVAGGVFPGAAAALALPDGAVAAAVAGDVAASGAAVSHRTRFDLASLTKLFTALAIARLVDRGALGLDDPCRRFFPALAGAPLGAVSVELLLAHESGLPAWRPLYEAMPAGVRGAPAGAGRLVELAAGTPLEAAPKERAVYSDLGFILLGAIAARAGECSLAELLEREVTGPLGLDGVAPRPAGPPGPKTAADAFAHTERCPWRGRVLVDRKSVV